MNTVVKWVSQNLVLPFAMMAVTAAGAGVYEATEIDSAQYAILGRMCQQGTDRYRAAVADVAGRGSISKWTYIDLSRDFWTDARGYYVPVGAKESGVSGREELLAVIKAGPVPTMGH